MEGANYCKKCGFSLISNQQPISSTNTKSDSNFKVIVICLTIIIIAGIAMIAIFASGILDNNNANYPVSNCWSKFSGCFFKFYYCII